MVNQRRIRNDRTLFLGHVKRNVDALNDFPVQRCFERSAISWCPANRRIIYHALVDFSLEELTFFTKTQRAERENLPFDDLKQCQSRWKGSDIVCSVLWQACYVKSMQSQACCFSSVLSSIKDFSHPALSSRLTFFFPAFSFLR